MMIPISDPLAIIIFISLNIFFILMWLVGATMEKLNGGNFFNRSIMDYDNIIAFFGLMYTYIILFVDLFLLLMILIGSII